VRRFRGIIAGRSIQRIARDLGRSPSTVSREIGRNGGSQAYRATVVAALTKHIGKLPQELRRSLTWDCGEEVAAHKSFTVATNVRVYFGDPRSPWQRGTNENTNGLLRQYFTKGTDLSPFSQAYLNKIALRLNHRPRKTLGFETPSDKLGLVLP
jgi:IS30 family transposase